VVSSTPIIVQATVGERLFHERVTNSLTTFMFHPGSLGDLEKQCYYIDYVYITSERFPLEERECLAILTPNNTEAHCMVTFIPIGGVDLSTNVSKSRSLAEQEVSLTVPAERIEYNRLGRPATIAAQPALRHARVQRPDRHYIRHPP
jgi:hypothetical protein